METDENESKSVDILHPEILSKDDLVALLTQRYIKVDRLHATKDDLIELFHRTVTPLHQREPRPNRRGRQINKVHKKLQAQQRLRGDSDEGSKIALKIVFTNSGKNQKGAYSALTSSSSPGLCRLKPPPVVSSKQRSIRLNNAAATPTSSAKRVADPSTASVKDNSSLAGNSTKKLVIAKNPVQVKSASEPAESRAEMKHSHSGSTSDSPLATRMRKISLKSSGSGTLKTGIKRTAPMDVNGKTSTSSSDEKIKTPSSEEESSSKKKIKRIAWP